MGDALEEDDLAGRPRLDQALDAHETIAVELGHEAKPELERTFVHGTTERDGTRGELVSASPGMMEPRTRPSLVGHALPLAAPEEEVRRQPAVDRFFHRRVRCEESDAIAERSSAPKGEVDLREDHAIGELYLRPRFGFVEEELPAFGVDHGDDSPERHRRREAGVSGEPVDDRRRIRDAGRLDDDRFRIEAEHAIESLEEGSVDRAADAARGEEMDVPVQRLEEMMIDPELPDLVHEHGQTARRRFPEQPREHGALAGAEKPRQEVNRNAEVSTYLPTSDTLVRMEPRFLIDTHVHLNNYHESTRRPTEENVHHLFATMDAVGIDHAVVITSYKVDVDRPSVEQLLEILSGDPRTTVFEGLRWRGDERTDLFSLEERIRDGIVRGIKLYPGYDLYPINDPSLESVFRIAAKHNVPVMIHTGDTYSRTAKVRMAHPLLVDDVAVDHPDVQIVMCHLGNPWFQDAAEVLYKNDNVFADISGLTLGKFTYELERYVAMRLKEMIAYMGNPGRQLMYGSDWPLVEMGPYLKFLDELKFTPEELDCIAWRTASRLFKIDVDALETRRAAASNARGSQTT